MMPMLNPSINCSGTRMRSSLDRKIFLSVDHRLRQSRCHGSLPQAGDERRSLVVVPAEKWNPWLGASSTNAAAMLDEMNDNEFTAEPDPVRRAQKELS